MTVGKKNSQKKRAKCSECSKFAIGAWTIDPDIPGVKFCKKDCEKAYIKLLVALIERDFHPVIPPGLSKKPPKKRRT